MKWDTSSEEREALAREIAETRGVPVSTARKLVTLVLSSLKRVAERWDRAAEAQRSQEPPTA